MERHVTSGIDAVVAHRHLDASERLGLDPTSELWGEHRSRYRFAASQAVSRAVLDAACGSGFGSHMIKLAGARLVVGLDLSQNALVQARTTSSVNVGGFVQGQLEKLPFPPHAFDLIVSMETIEHVAHPEQVLAEFARCLAPSGTLILSTPNRLYRPTPDGRPTNPYHLREYAPDELKALLSAWFSVRLFGQTVDAAYTAVPYLLRAEDRGFRSWRAIRLIPWKLMNRLPYRVKDKLSRFLSGRAFYPTELDYSFRADGVQDTHDLVALATPLER